MSDSSFQRGFFAPLANCATTSIKIAISSHTNLSRKSISVYTMRIVASALVLLTPLVSASFLRDVAPQTDERELQTIDTCEELFDEVWDTCRTIGCYCPGDVRPTLQPSFAPIISPGRCEAKAVKMAQFESRGEDSRVVDEWDGYSRNSQCPGNVCPIEFRWTLLDDIPHYPANMERCGPDAAVSGVPRDLHDGERYCQMYFGSTLDTSDVTPRQIRNNNRPIAFRMFESDNQADTSTTVPFVPFQIDGYFDSSQWYSNTCTVYRIEYYESYFNGNSVGDNQRVPPYLCYRTQDNSALDLSIPRCRFNNLPTDNHYRFAFEITSI